MRRDQACATATSSERGFVIVAVLWILAALAALAAIFSLYLSGSARALVGLGGIGYVNVRFSGIMVLM